MKKSQTIFAVMLAGFLFAAAAARAVLFTTNTAIGPFDATYDGADIVISNCIVTVDGAHAFASVLVATGGTLTHSSWPSGQLASTFFVTNEPQFLIGTNPATLLHTNVSSSLTVTDSGKTTTYSNGVDYVQTNLPDGTTQIQRTGSSTIPDGATVLVSYTWSFITPAGLYLTATNSVGVARGGSINASGCGYGPGLGTGGGVSSGGAFYDGSGAGHGGYGGMSLSNAFGGGCYGSLYQPATLGSGGGASYAGNGGSGGGLVQIVAGGNVNIDGTVSVNGADATNSRAGGGAGGGIWISAARVSGSGSLAANGGAGAPLHGGGGGGGRIAIQCGTNSFSGTLTAFGGGGWQTGGAGTIYTQITDQTGLLLVDNGGNSGTSSTVSLPTISDVLIRSGGKVGANGAFSPRSLTIGTNGVLFGQIQSNFMLSVVSNAVIEPGGLLSVDSLGYSLGNGPGAGHYYWNGSYYLSGGGGYGGYGAAGSVTNAGGGSTYGSQPLPTSLGSSGGYNQTAFGGGGGGAIQVTVAGSLRVDGAITANGGNGFGAGGGGSGGSIFINSGTLAGSGSITANGGNGAASLGGGGGGGRIAVIVGTNLFSGNINAYGGSGANWGGAGTVYLQSGISGGPQLTQLVLDNAAHIGASTPLQDASSANLTVQNSAVGTASSSVSFASLWVGSNAWLTALVPYGSGSFTINGNATFQAGGGFLADSGGYGSGQGNGAGKNTTYSPYACSGGGYGGTGGSCASNAVVGGVSYDSASAPSASYPASGGGGYSPYSTGGSGGGYVQMTVNGTLQLDGLISANGGNGSGLGGGGGAGGGIYLSAGTFAGSGAIRANGGNGVDGLGGGGGGGRIAVYFNTNNFAGVLSAFGGGGASYGGAGTIYLGTNSTGRALEIVDNGGHAGADSGIQYSSTTDLTLRNGGLVYPYNPVNFGNLIVSSNAWLITTNTPMSITANNVIVQAGGGILADSAGSVGNQGNGHGNYSASPPYQGSGGGHGGFGANGFTNGPVGGVAYDSVTAPISAGSGGGGYSPFTYGGNGGGNVRMTISGALQVDGVVSANGGNGSANGGGGGSGGSLNLGCAILSGTGSLSAIGGNGGAGYGGGGGGGMIAVNFTTNLFAGTVSAYGGGGANYGGAGTIYYHTNLTGQSLLIVDNAGHRGTNTPVPAANNLVLRNGAVAFQAFPPQTVSSLLITSNAWLVGNTVPGNNYPGIVNLTVNGNATIQAGGGVVTDASGSPQNNGTGRGFAYGSAPWFQCSGAGHGGYGAFAFSNLVAGGITYDSTTAPATVGSGGGGYFPYSAGGAGGGYVNLHVSGVLQLDGVITANGGNGSGAGGGGGAGGSIYLYTVNSGALAGSGSITANGGNGALAGGGGGGGRIAVIINNAPRYPPLTNSFAGTVSAYGGGGANYGGAGTIYYQTNGQPYALLVLDNANNAGTNTSFDSLNLDITIQNKAIGLLPAAGSWSPHNIFIHSNSALTAFALAGPRILNANNITIDSGGSFSLDGAGYGPQSGAGAGNNTGSVRGGGGHGGYGGGNFASGGGAYDVIQSPNNAGSGGATYYTAAPQAYGGYGGGALQLNANILTVNGRLSANGLAGGTGAGGGSGGSVYLANIGSLTGNGVISANGGSASSTAGGGGGGRIALVCTDNNFTGQFSASGGNGTYPGGAGTIYTSVSGVSTLTVDNGSLGGTNTPLSSAYSLPAAPFNLHISGGASVVPLTPLPLVSNLTVGAGSTLTMPFAQSKLIIAVQKNANLAGSLEVDYLGYAQSNGPGAGSAIANKGSGGGYGGSGGASSSGAPGGTNYGSATQPVDFGSGGGNGVNTVTGGSDGGGALRLSVGGALNVGGNISANGNAGAQDDSGGGSGGSVWITAGTLSGTGTISVAGGNGAPLGGGGGGGGRIAIYTPTSSFLGTTNINGGAGATPGQPGTLYLSTVLPAFQIVSQSPTGVVANTVAYVDLSFSEGVDPASVSSSDFGLATPAGMLAASNLTALASGPFTVRVSFPAQNLLGNYTLQAATAITNIFGLPLAQSYAGTFSILLPTISGTVTDTNGAPVTGVLLQPDGGLTGVATDTNGNYALGVPPGWNGTVMPTLGSFMFVPGSLSYTNVTSPLTNQNYLIVLTVAPNLASSLSGTNLSLAWFGLPGVAYQAWWSTNLVDWQPFGGVLPGTNGPMQILLPVSGPAGFFRVSASY